MFCSRKERLHVKAEGQECLRSGEGDMAGNLFLCPIEALKDPKEVSQEEMELCVDNAVAERYGGEIKVEDQ